MVSRPVAAARCGDGCLSIAVRDDAYVLDMLLAAREALDFAAAVDFDAFRGNRMAQLAILKAIEIVGEAAPMSLRSSQQRIPTSRGGHRRHAQPPRPRLRRH